MRRELPTADAGHTAVHGHPVEGGVRRTASVLSAVAVAGLAAAAGRGLWPGAAGPDLHAAAGLVGGALAAGAHIRWGAGRDLLATLLLAAGVLLGMGVSGGLVSPGVHGLVALVAGLFSMGVHGEHLWQRFRS
jgi:hypothetical protein